MKGKGNARKIYASAAMVVVSAVLLIGLTFAWFTDSVTNKGNKIQAGTLGIAATVAAADGEGTGFIIAGVNGGDEFGFDQAVDVNESTPIISEDKWEPGQSNAKLLTVSNDGSLAAKVKLSFDVQDAGLQDALWVDFVRVNEGQIVGQFTKRPMSDLATLADSVEVPVAAGESVQFMLVYGMSESAGNEYQGKSFVADVTILATQDTVEADGFGNTDYDAGATYPWDGKSVEEVEPEADGTTYELATAENFAWLVQEINDGTSFSGKSIELSSDIDMGGQPIAPIAANTLLKDATIDGNGHAIKNLNIKADSYSGYGTALINDCRTAITIKDLTIDGADINGRGRNVVGIVMDYAYGTTVFENVSVTNSKVTGYGKVGVILGMGAQPGMNVTFKNCTSANNHVYANYNAGGLAGNIQRKGGVDNTQIIDCTVENNTFHQLDWHGVTLTDVAATFKSNDSVSGTDVTRTISGKYWLNSGSYLYGQWAEYYVSYGNSSYDAPITTGEHVGKCIANSEICVNDPAQIPGK